MRSNAAVQPRNDSRATPEDERELPITAGLAIPRMRRTPAMFTQHFAAASTTWQSDIEKTSSKVKLREGGGISQSLHKL